MNEPTAFGKSKAELGAMLDSISSHTDENHPFNSDNQDSLEFLESGMEKLSSRSDAKETFGVSL